MEDTNSSKSVISKVVFAAILMVAIAAAWMLSNRRTTLIMQPAAPICGELTVSMPAGPYWQSASKGNWVYQQNTFTLKSVHGSAQDCAAEVRYQLSPITEEPDKYFAGAGRSWGFDIQARGQVKAGNVNIEWAGYANAGQQPHVYYALAALNPERAVTILVWGKAGTSALTATVFEAIATSLKYADAGLLASGAVLVKAVKEGGLSPLAQQCPSDSQVIKDPSGNPTGFIVTRTLVTSKPDEVLMEAMVYSNDGATRFYRTRFSTSDVSDFVWYTWNPNNPGFGATVRTEDGILLAAVRGYPGRTQFALSDTAIAEAIVEMAGWQLLAKNLPEAAVDAVTFEGAIEPTRISPGRAPTDTDKWKFSVRFSRMMDPKQYTDVFFDANGVVVGRTEHRQETFTYERASIDELLKLFPQFAAEMTQFHKGSIQATPIEKEIDYGRGPI